MPSEILIDAVPGETRVAQLADGRLVDLVIARDGADSLIGNIYVGIVGKRMPGIEGAFVDIGLGAPGFLPLPKRRAALAEVTEGARILVQVTREAMAEKGAVLTRRIALAGQYLVFFPGMDRAEPMTDIVSPRITPKDERQRLEDAVRQLALEGESWQVRTGAAAADAALLEWEAAHLRTRWAGIAAAGQDGAAAGPCEPPISPAERALRDWAGAAAAWVVIDGAAAYAALRSRLSVSMPWLVSRMERHDGASSLFAERGIEDAIDDLVSPDVALPGGGRVRIERTAGATVIDVDSASASGQGGKQQTVRAVNLAAAAEIPWQLRLRGLGGLILIDFISMRRGRDGAELLDRLRAALEESGAGGQLLGSTKGGLVELRRPWRQRPVGEILTGGGKGKTPETAGFDALRAAGRAAVANPGAKVVIVADPATVDALAEKAGVIQCRPDRAMGRGQFEILIG